MGGTDVPVIAREAQAWYNIFEIPTTFMVEYDVRSVVPFMRGRKSLSPYLPYKEVRLLGLSLESPDGMRTSRPPDAPVEQGRGESPEAREAARQVAKTLKTQRAEAEQKEQFEISEKMDRRMKYTTMTTKELENEGATLAGEIELAEARIALFEAGTPFDGYAKGEMLKDYARIAELKEDLSIIFSLCNKYEAMSRPDLIAERQYNLGRKEKYVADARRFVDNLEYGKKMKQVASGPSGAFLDPKIQQAREGLRVVEARLKLIDEELAKRGG
jgi:hypothetical protein